MIKNDKKLIIVAHASTGSGHTIAAEAISAELEKVYPQAQVQTVDILDYFTKDSSGEKFVSAVSGALAPIYDHTWRNNFTGKILWGGGNLWPSFLYKEFEDYLIWQQPDVIICTHQVCANVAAKVRSKIDHPMAIVSVPTDYETEGLWPHKHTDLFCVANEEMALTLASRKISNHHILVTGLPVEETFGKRISKASARNKLGLPKDKKIALVIVGAKESGPYKNIRKTINDCIKLFSQMDWMHFIFCVGADGNYASKLIKKSNRFKAKNITVLTYTDNLPALMAASDIALIKPGGLIITECADARLPIILVGKTYAQENINRRYLVSMDAAEHALTYKGVVNLLSDIFTDEDRYKMLKKNLKNISKNNAAENIANAVKDILENGSFIGEKHSKLSLYFGENPAHTR